MHDLRHWMTLIETAAGQSRDGDAYFDWNAPFLIEQLAETRATKSRATLVTMSPADFVRMAETDFSAEKQAGVRAVLARGARFFSLPLLGFVHDGEGHAQVENHEGRHRALCLHALGVRAVPVILNSKAGGGGRAIRWDQQDDPTGWDYVPVPPHTLHGETSGVMAMPQSLIYPKALIRPHE